MIEKREQIRLMHAPFIHAMAKACSNEQARLAFEPQIKVLQKEGWNDLAVVAQRMLNGERSETLLHGLDDEDVIIVSAILDGIQNPNTLPDIKAQGQASDAAPGLASIIHAAGSGDAGALNALSIMAEQMSQTGGAMAEIAGAIKRLVDGERDFDVLSKKMRGDSKDLLIGILNELGKLTVQ
ncbi:MAG: hypothetical protein V3V09_09045 [Arenicellales bacterium]